MQLRLCAADQQLKLLNVLIVGGLHIIASYQQLSIPFVKIKYGYEEIGIEKPSRVVAQVGSEKLCPLSCLRIFDDDNSCGVTMILRYLEFVVDIIISCPLLLVIFYIAYRSIRVEHILFSSSLILRGQCVLKGKIVAIGMCPCVCACNHRFHFGDVICFFGAVDVR